MISSSNYKSVKIDIITYKKLYKKAMNEGKSERDIKNNHNRFICSVCLNKKPSREEIRNMECCKQKSKSCPICEKSNFENSNEKSANNQSTYEYNKHARKEKVDGNGKDVQTSQPDITQGLSLLNEVLTVFQKKKQSINKKENKTIILKDACIETDFKMYNPKLTKSKIFHYSIDDTQAQNSQFVVINSQPEVLKSSQFSIDLIKHKSSSIPQMKLEELKNSLKEKTKSKDAIEEANRMFATVRKSEINESSEVNRPMIRSGPRILPVVKTGQMNDMPLQNCRYCQTNYRMSSGDTIDCCHRNQEIKEQCIHTKCCHYQRKSSGPTCSHCIGCEHRK